MPSAIRMDKPSTLRTRITRLFLPIGLSIAALLGMALWFVLAAPDGMTAATQATLVCLTGAVALGLAFWAFRDSTTNLVEPVEALTEAARRAQDGGAVAIAGVRRAGYLTPLIRDISAALEVANENASTSDALPGGAVRTRLETVLRDLHDGVMICTLDHKLLLYNRRALAILHVSGDVGLDRPLFSLMAAQPFRHTLHRLTTRFREGRHRDHEEGLSAIIIASTADGRYTIQGRMSLMLNSDEREPVGYVVTFDDVTDALSAALYRERALFDLTESLRRRIASLRLAADMLVSGADTVTRAHCEQVVADDSAALSEEVGRLDGISKDILASAWPMSAVFSTTLFACIEERNSEGRALSLEVAGDPVWLRCDSASVTELLDRLANRIAVHSGAERFEALATRATHGEAFLDLIYQGAPVPIAVLETWLDEPLDPDLGALTGSDVLHRHRTDMWCSALDPSTARLRLPLPVAADVYARFEKTPVPLPERREFYDFELLERTHAGLHPERPLDTLTCVVFDTETTGLEPSSGDEIISIAGVRIVNGRLLHDEIFNEFVNPGRTIPAASTKVHGITDAMVADAPEIVSTLPRFHRFCGDGVLVAHNAAFDLKFLSLKEKQAGVTFDHAVLDSLLLAAVAFGRDDDLTLDALAERFNVFIAPEDRHTALGDAIATGAVLLKLFPILEARGITTLGDALHASEQQFAIRRMQANF